jgi:galactose mutarotase-like enzyme
MQTIENNFIQVGILEEGGQLCSYIDKQNNREVIWTGDPEYWGRHSPILFPLVGKIENGEYRLDNKSYNLSAHGFARDKKFCIPL